MKRLAVLAALLLGACVPSGQPVPVDNSVLNVLSDSAHGVVCYTVRGYSYPACLQIRVDTITVRDGTSAVPRNPGSAWQHDGHIDRV